MATNEVKVDQDPINYLSEKDREVLGKSIEGLTVPQIMDLRQQAVILKNQYRTHAMKTNPTSAAVFENATITKIDILNTKRAATGVNYIAKQMATEGRKEAKSILEKFSQNYYGDNIIRDTQGLNPLQSIQKFNEFEEKKPNSVRQAETIAQNEEQFQRLQQRVGTTTPAEGNVSILDTKNGYLGNFKDKEAALALLKSCIPCEFRIADFSATYSTPWASTIKDLNQKWKDLLKMLRDLSMFQPGEFSADLCNLFKFLDGQCIPDITGLLSLLSMMQLKYLDLSATSLENIINQLIAPFLTPVIGSFTSNLDQYIDLIVGPLRCVTRALEHQIITLQEQINGAINIADQNTIKYRLTQVDFYDAKIKALRNRKLSIQNADQARAIRQAGGSGADVKLDGNVLTPNPYPEFSSNQRPDLTRQERIVQTKLVTGGIRIGGTQTADSSGSESLQLTNKEELTNIDNEIAKLQAKKNAIREDLKKNTSYTPTNFNGAITMTRATQNALNNFERSFKSIIGDLTDAINDGINIVKQSVDIYRDEFQRLIMGRVTTQQDQLEFTRLLQKILRLTSIVRTVNDFALHGKSLKKICERGEKNTLTQVVKGIKQNNGMYDFYQAQNSEGNPLILIAPGGATVNVSSIEFGDVTDDALFADANFDLDAVTKTVSFNDLNEVDKLNREGIVPDLGNIDGKQIELSNKTKIGSELDLHFKTSYAIISSEFCSKSAINFGTSDTVKQWAASLWQKN